MSGSELQISMGSLYSFFTRGFFDSFLHNQEHAALLCTEPLPLMVLITWNWNYLLMFLPPASKLKSRVYSLWFLSSPAFSRVSDTEMDSINICVMNERMNVLEKLTSDLEIIMFKGLAWLNPKLEYFFGWSIYYVMA